MSPSRKTQEISPAAGFERGANVAPGASSPDLSRPLESAPGTDHFAAVEYRRIEMIQEWDGKISDLKARAADLKQRAAAKNGEAHGWFSATCTADASTMNRTLALQTEAGTLAQEARRLINVDLQNLELERNSIAAGAHPTIAYMRIAAEGRIKADLESKRQASGNKLPSFVVLDDHFGWRENEQMVNFAEGQIVRDPALIRQLIERGAPLELGA